MRTGERVAQVHIVPASSAAQFNGTVTIKLDDGTQIDATWDKSLGSQPTLGMKLEVAPTGGKSPWKVVRIVKTP